MASVDSVYFSPELATLNYIKSDMKAINSKCKYASHKFWSTKSSLYIENTNIQPTNQENANIPTTKQECKDVSTQGIQPEDINEEDRKIVNKVGYLPTRFVHIGPFSRIYVVTDNKGMEYIAKVESSIQQKRTLGLEARVYKDCDKSPGFAKLYRCADMAENRILVMQKLGTDLSRIRRVLPEKKFSVVDALKVCTKTFVRIWRLHKCGWLHRDIKLSNFVVGMPPDDQIYIVDFGLSRPITDNMRPNGQGPFVGTPAYQSIAAHNRLEFHEKDDLESWFYLCVHLITGTLPWINTPAELMADFKKFCMTSGRHLLVKELPSQFDQIFDIILCGSDRIDYYKISALLQCACADQGEEKMKQCYPWMLDPNMLERALQLKSEN